MPRKISVIAMTSALLCCEWAQAAADGAPRPQSAAQRDNEGWAAFLDNDALALSKRDRDYTGGLAVTLAGERARRWWFSLDPILRISDGWLGLDQNCAAQNARHALQFGVLAFTPGETHRPAAPGDRRTKPGLSGQQPHEFSRAGFGRAELTVRGRTSGR